MLRSKIGNMIGRLRFRELALSMRSTGVDEKGFSCMPCQRKRKCREQQRRLRACNLELKKVWFCWGTGSRTWRPQLAASVP